MLLMKVDQHKVILQGLRQIQAQHLNERQCDWETASLKSYIFNATATQLEIMAAAAVTLRNAEWFKAGKKAIWK